MSALPRMRAESVQPSFGRQVRSMGIFHRGEAAEMNNLPIEADWVSHLEAHFYLEG